MDRTADTAAPIRSLQPEASGRRGKTGPRPLRQIRRSLVFSFAERYGTTTIALAGTLLLSRLLTPADFGLFSVAASVVMMVEVVREFGVGHYLVQERALDRAVVRTAFSVSLALSLACAAALAALAGPLAAFYDSPKLATLVPLLAASFLLVPFGMPSSSLLRRDMQFGALAAVGIASALANVGVTAVLAWLGWGATSLAWGSLATGLTRAAGGLAWRPCLWAFRPGFAEWRRVLAFGGYASATAIVNVLHDTLPQLILGRMLGFGPVGLFARATGVCQIPDRLFTNALPGILLPALAEQVRQGVDLKPAYLRALTYATAVQWPVLLCLVVLAEPVVRVLLGPQWGEAVPLVRLMALAALTLFPSFLTYPLLVAVGAVRDTLLMSLLSVPPSALLVFAASFHGLAAVAATQLVTGPLQVGVALIFVRRHVAFRWREFARALAPSALVALAAAVPALGVVSAFGGFGLSPLGTVAAGLAAVAGWAGGIGLSGHPLRAELRPVLARLVSAGRVSARWAGRAGAKSRTPAGSP